MVVVLISLYLAAIVAANLLIAAFGPPALIPVAFVLIGLDLTVRDRLHDVLEWHGGRVWPRMAAIVATGSLLAWALNADAGRVAVASAVAFGAAGATDAVVYHVLRRRPYLTRVNGSNVPAALVDSLLFPTIAFGAVLPLAIAGQFAAKVVGGLVWSLVLLRVQIWVVDRAIRRQPSR